MKKNSNLSRKEKNHSESIDGRWLKASVIGSMWGSMEIIIGSFLHNLNIPLAGTLLSMIGIILMVGMHRIWPERGLFWRAGVICAVMKSISPSAIIIGPMLGILMEAALLEISVLIFGRNLVSYMFGGALAVFSTFLYKIIGFIIFYGFNIVELFVNVYQFAVKQLKIENFGPWALILTLSGIYMTLGIIAAVMGHLIGLKAAKTDAAVRSAQDYSLQKGPDWNEDADQKYSKRLAMLHAVVLIIGFIFISYINMITAAVLVIIYGSICFFMYRRALRRLKKPILWIQFVIIFILAGLFLGQSAASGSVGWSFEGIYAGIQMNLRALFVIFNFTALSIELRNPFIKGVVRNKRWSKLYLSIELAFEILPATLERLAKPIEFIKNPLSGFTRLVHEAQNMLRYLQTREVEHPSVFFITGEVGEGKSTLLKHIVRHLKEKGFQPKGIIAEGHWENGTRSGFDMININGGSGIPLCRHYNTDNWIPLGRFFFSPEAIQYGQDILKQAESNDTEVVVLDEIGKFELEGQLWANALTQLVQKNKILLLSVRKRFVQSVINKWNLNEVAFLQAGQSDPLQAADQIESAILYNRTKLMKKQSS